MPFGSMGLGLGLMSGTASGALVIPAYAGALADEFESGSQKILDRPNWTMPQFAGTRGDGTNGDPDKFVVDSCAGIGGFIHMTADNFNTTALNALYFGASQLATVSDFSADFGYDLSAVHAGTCTAGTFNNATIRFWQTDANNYLELQFDTTNSRLVLAGKLGGGVIKSTFWNQHPGSALLTFLTRGNLHVEVNAGKLRIALDGVWLTGANILTYPYDVFDLSTLQFNSDSSAASYSAAGKNVGAVGFLGKSKQNAMLQYIRVKPATVQIAFNDQFVGRDSTTATGGTARLEMTYTGSPVKWVARVLKVSDGSVVVDWALLSSAAQCSGSDKGITGAGTMCASIFLPIGGPYQIEAGYIGTDGLLHTALSRHVCSGYKVAFYGQSNANGRDSIGTGAFNGTASGPGAAWFASGTASETPAQALNDISGATHNQTREVFAAYSAEPATHGISAYWTAQIMSSLMGKPVGVQVLGSGGNPIANLSDATKNQTKDFQNGVTWAPGICEAMLWDQGEGDADGSTPPTGYASSFVSNLLPIVRTACGNPNMPVVISPVGRFASTSVIPGSPATTTQVNVGRETLRQQYLAAVASDPIGKTYLSDSKLGAVHPTDTNGAYHYPSANGYNVLNKRAAYSLAKYGLGLNIYDGRGPLITSASRSGAVITLTLDLNGAASLAERLDYLGSTGNDPTDTTGQGANTVKGFQVSADGFSTYLAISSVTTDGTHITITLASDPGGPVAIRSHYGWNYLDHTLFWGTGYGDGRDDIPVFPLFRNGTQLTSN